MQTSCIKTCNVACVPVTPPPSPHRTTRPKSTQTLPPFEDDPNWCQRGTKKAGEFLCLDGTRCAGTKKSKRVNVFVTEPAEYIVYYEACCNAHGGIENCPLDAHFMQNLKFIQETDADNPGSPCNDHCCVGSHQDELGVAGGNRKCPEKPVGTTRTTTSTNTTSSTSTTTTTRVVGGAEGLHKFCAERGARRLHLRLSSDQRRVESREPDSRRSAVLQAVDCNC